MTFKINPPESNPNHRNSKTINIKLTSFGKFHNKSLPKEPDDIQKNKPPHRRKLEVCRNYCYLLFGLISLLLGILSIKYTLFNLLMTERLRMTPGFPPFEWWLNPKPEILCRIHIFTVSNADEFLAGEDAKVRIKEFGPIIYREIIKHSDVVFHENSTLTYTITRHLEFVPELNEPKVLNTTITVPNIVLLGMVTMVQDYPISLKFGFNMLSKRDPVFTNVTVYNYLWNLTTPALETVKRYIPFMVPQKNGGVLHNVYNDFVDRVNVKYGEKNGFENFFKINTFNYRPTAPGYQPEKGDCYASIVNSTEGAIYPNFLKKDSVLLYWRKTICRPVPLYFEQEVQKGQIKAYKYIARASIYDRLDNLTADCYKGKDGVVLPDGLSDVSKCYHNLPVAASLPHFYGRSGYWEDQLEGLSPSKKRHGSFTILEPTTGIPMEQIARSQSNMIMPKLRSFNSNVMRFSERIVPIFWMEYHQEKLTPDILGLMTFMVSVLIYLQYVISLVLIILGLLCLRTAFKRIKTEFKTKKFTTNACEAVNKDNKY